jgi:hypothetical protein
VEPVDPADWLRIAEPVGRYRNLPLGTVDAPVVAVGERLGITEVATVDRHHFSVSARAMPEGSRSCRNPLPARPRDPLPARPYRQALWHLPARR